MLYKIENNRKTWTPVLITDSKDLNKIDFDKTFSSRGIGLNETYKLSWKMNHSGYQRVLFEVKGMDLINRSTKVLNRYFSEKLPNGKYPDMNDVKELTQTFVNLYGHGLVEPNTFHTLKKRNHLENYKLVKRVLKKRKGDDWELVLSMMCTYLMFKFEQSDSDKKTNHLVVVDHLSQPKWIEESKDKSSEMYWKNQPIVRRNNWTWEEFKQSFEYGFLKWEWVK